jgi:peptidoglycan/LPS O-acetylase OafA/YrhL
MRIRSIDFLRGIAVFLVFCRHIPLEPILTVIGWVGVDLFFVLSGFLVSNLLFMEYRQTKTIRPLRFILRRGLKIYPLYYLMIATFLGASIYFEPNYWANHQKNLLVECIFVQNYLPQYMMTNHTWSLAVEEHFYIGLALLIFIFVKTKLIENSQFFNILSILIMLLCLNMRKNILLPMEGFPNFQKFYLPTHMRIDTLWVGVFLAYHFNFSNEKFVRIFKGGGWACGGLFAVGMSTCYIIENKFMGTIGLTIMALCFGATLGAFVADNTYETILDKLFGKRLVDLVARLGTYSYALYLFHEVFIYYFKPFKDPIYAQASLYNTFEGRINFVFVFISTLIASIVLTEYIEKPILRWRNRKLSH